jgi:hypothetical protein
MNLYKLQKNFCIKFKSFSYNKPGIFKNFHRLSFLCCLEMSAALSAGSVHKISTFKRVFSFFKVSILLFFPGLESNGLCSDPLAGPRSCQRAPQWVQRCTRFWWLTCHFGERTWVNSCFSSDWRCPDWLYRWANRFDVDWLDETSVLSITMCFVVILDPVVWVCLTETCNLPSEGPLLCDRVLKLDSLARSE